MDDRFKIKYTKTNREMAAKSNIQQQQRQDDVMENGEKKLAYRRETTCENGIFTF